MNFSKKFKESFFQQNSFAIYGLGVTGRSVINLLNKKKIDNFFIWDDSKAVRDFHRINKKYNLLYICLKRENQKKQSKKIKKQKN